MGMQTAPASMAEELDNLILSEYPYPIAVNYRRMLDTQGWELKTRRCLEVFEYGLRVTALVVLSQYLIRDVDEVSDYNLDRLLQRKLVQASLGDWVEFLFHCLRAYDGRRELFFVPEFYDFYWDTSVDPHRRRSGVRPSFDHLLQIRNDLIHLRHPNREERWEDLCAETLGLLRTVFDHFSFLKEYDLVRIIDVQEGEAAYECYTGQEVTVHREALRGNGSLREGWIYLRRNDLSFLKLHPFVIFWSGEQREGIADGAARDAAIFDILPKQWVQYSSTVRGEIVRSGDAEALVRFRELLDLISQRHHDV